MWRPDQCSLGYQTRPRFKRQCNLTAKMKTRHGGFSHAKRFYCGTQGARHTFHTAFSADGPNCVAAPTMPRQIQGENWSTRSDRGKAAGPQMG